MMTLGGPDGRFDLEVVTPVSADRTQWCRIRVTVDYVQDWWSASDTCLMVEEVEQLANWLETAATETPVPNLLTFVEPELSFQLRDGEPRLLRICLRYGLRRPTHSDRAEPSCFDYPAEPGQSHRAAEALRGQLERGSH
jgi:hypothetical protein